MKNTSKLFGKYLSGSGNVGAIAETVWSSDHRFRTCMVFHSNGFFHGPARSACERMSSCKIGKRIFFLRCESWKCWFDCFVVCTNKKRWKRKKSRERYRRWTVQFPFCRKVSPQSPHAYGLLAAEVSIIFWTIHCCASQNSSEGSGGADMMFFCLGTHVRSYNSAERARVWQGRTQNASHASPIFFYGNVIFFFFSFRAKKKR